MAIFIDVKFKGLREIQQKMKQASVAHQEAFAAALFQEGTNIADDSQKRVPEQTGDLKRSIFVTRPDAEDPFIGIGYSIPYAVFVHEITENNHPNGEAKFLKRAIDATRRGRLNRIAKNTASNVRSKIKARSVSAKYSTIPTES